MSTSQSPSSSGPEQITQPEQGQPDWAIDFFNRATISDTVPLQLWSPPPDPDKPRLPYLPGLALQIERHVPPGSPEDQGLAPRPHLSPDYLDSLPQSEIVAANPSIETAPPSNPGRAQLVVTAPIAIGSSRGAQVVGCTIFPQSDKGGKEAQPFQATAKIYDPLYYNFNMEMIHHARDIVYEADNDYSNEARAYEHLLMAGQAGYFAPAYYGSWTFSLPISIKGRRQSRSVRLVLIERLHGTTIEDTRVKNHPEPSMGLDSFHYPEEFRLEVVAQVLEGLAKQQQTGLDHGDFVGRNVLLVQSEFDPSKPSTETCGGLSLPRVVLIDYNHARIMSRGSRPHPLPESPASIYMRNDIYEGFSGWAPREWEDEEVEREWLTQRFCKDDQSQLSPRMPFCRDNMAPKADPATTQSAKKPAMSTAPDQSKSTAGATKPVASHSSNPAHMEIVTNALSWRTPTPTSTTNTASTSTSSSAGKPATTRNSSIENPRLSVSSGSATTNSDREPPPPPMLSIGNKPGEFWPFGTLTNLLPANQRNLKAAFAAAALAAHPASVDTNKE